MRVVYWLGRLVLARDKEMLSRDEKVHTSKGEAENKIKSNRILILICIDLSLHYSKHIV